VRLADPLDHDPVSRTRSPRSGHGAPPHVNRAEVRSIQRVSKPQETRTLGLDILRFAAVFLVLGRHMSMPPGAPNAVLSAWQRAGWVGVDLFFVLSGFLVSSLLFREFNRTGRIDIKRFLIRRGFKIYPAFWAFLLFSVVVKVLDGQPLSTRRLLGELLFLQNYLGGVWNHTWSLAVEEHFYIGIAALFGTWAWLRPQMPLSAIPATFMVVAVACASLRIATSVLVPAYDHGTHLSGTHIRIDALFFGVLLSYLWMFRDLKAKLTFLPSWLLLGFGAALLAPAFFFQLETHLFMATYGVILHYVGSGSILIAALRLPDSRSSVLRFLGVLGAASYSIYLWHLPVGGWGYTLLRRITGVDSFPVYFSLYIVGSCAFGLIMSRLIEFPVLRIREALFPTAAPSAQEPPEAVRAIAA
jgi:peptidoglycan/LPS O-acetylase OafA/YrhL